MIHSISMVKKEHLKIKEILSKIESSINEEKINYLNAMKSLEDLKSIWDKHEERENELFYFFQQLGRPFPVETMFLEQHRQFRGHLKVLQNAINSDDSSKIGIAFDTDGRLLIEKIRKHIINEDNFFNMFVVKKEEIEKDII